MCKHRMRQRRCGGRQTARDVVALAEEGSRGGLERRATFRRHVVEVAAGGGAATACTAATARCPAPAAGGSRAGQHVLEEEEERRGVRRAYVQN
jgi:hypothetical protein